MSKIERSSGLLLHLTSLPSPYGIGDLGPGADWFLDLLVETGQRWWQMLPVGPIGPGDSPYASPSSFAGNDLLISPDRLVEAGLLRPEEAEAARSDSTRRVDYAAVRNAKEPLLRAAAERFRPDADFEAFLERSADWLEDYCRFMALRRAFDDQPWTAWNEPLRHRDPEALRRWDEGLKDEIQYRRFVQYEFDRQWNRLKRRAAERGVGLIGDLPIFVSQDGSDVWSHRDLFRLDDQGGPTHEAGVPPDYFNADGQRWGNPLYRWEAHRADNFAWWRRRVAATLKRFDMLRFDHFRGLVASYAIPAEAESGADPSCFWEASPGRELLEAIRTHLDGRLPLIAEDLGVITEEVEALRDDFGLPGMRVLQFAFGDDPLAEFYLPHRYIQNCVAYTGTHDNDTTLGWYTAPAGTTTQPWEEVEAERAFARRYLGGSNPDIPRGFLRLAWGSVADLAVAPVQDLIGLGSEARMNRPGTLEGNWAWRLGAEDLSPSIRAWFAEQTAIFGRWNGPIPEALNPRFRPKRATDVPKAGAPAS